MNAAPIFIKSLFHLNLSPIDKVISNDSCNWIQSMVFHTNAFVKYFLYSDIEFSSTNMGHFNKK